MSELNINKLHLKAIWTFGLEKRVYAVPAAFEFLWANSCCKILGLSGHTSNALYAVAESLMYSPAYFLKDIYLIKLKVPNIIMEAHIPFILTPRHTGTSNNGVPIRSENSELLSCLEPNEIMLDFAINIWRETCTHRKKVNFKMKLFSAGCRGYIHL